MDSIATSFPFSLQILIDQKQHNRKKRIFDHRSKRNFQHQSRRQQLHRGVLQRQTEQTATGTVNHPQHLLHHNSLPCRHLPQSEVMMHFVKKKSVGMLIIIVFAQSANLLQKVGVRRPIKVNHVCKTVLFTQQKRNTCIVD